MEKQVIILKCDHLSGTSKKSGANYDFYTGSMLIDGELVDFTSKTPFVVDSTKKITVKLKITKCSIQ